MVRGQYIEAIRSTDNTLGEKKEKLVQRFSSKFIQKLQLLQLKGTIMETWSSRDKSLRAHTKEELSLMVTITQ